jgi:hypothetical protein
LLDRLGGIGLAAGGFTMTRDEILAQAKVGGFAVVRMQIADVNKEEVPEDHDILCLKTWYGSVAVSDCNVMSIEPPPETMEQENARLKAHIAELEALK